MIDNGPYGIIIISIFMIVILMTTLMYTNRLKNDVKNSVILLLLVIVNFFLMVAKENYKLGDLDYFLVAFLAICTMSKIIERSYKDDKREKIFEEERKWKETVFGANK